MITAAATSCLIHTVGPSCSGSAAGACAAAVAGMRRGLFDSEVELQMHGGRLRIEWDGTPTGSVFLIGPAATVFTGEIDVPAI